MDDISDSSKMDIPESWENSIQEIALRESRRVLVIGPGDSGKSTYCRVLLHQLLHSGSVAALVDADIGQKDAGPPATITWASPSNPPWKMTPEGIFFIGAVSPAGRFGLMAEGVRAMVADAEACLPAPRTLVINTTGFIHGPGRALKRRMIIAAAPDIIVGMGSDPDVAAIMEECTDAIRIRVEISAKAAPKTIVARRQARDRAFQKCFGSARSILLHASQVIIQRFAAASERWSAERAPGLTVEEDLFALPAGLEKGLLCGAIGAQGVCLGLGVIHRVDREAGNIRLTTPVPAKKIVALQLGSIHLDFPRKQGLRSRAAHKAGAERGEARSSNRGRLKDPG